MKIYLIAIVIGALLMGSAISETVEELSTTVASAHIGR